MPRLSPFSRFLVKLAAGAVALAGFAPALSTSADSPTAEGAGSQYIIVFKDAPAAEYRGGIPGLTQPPASGTQPAPPAPRSR